MNIQIKTEVKYDEATNEYYIEFDDDLMESLNWKVGDELEWIDNENGSYTIRKKQND